MDTLYEVHPDHSMPYSSRCTVRQLSVDNDSSREHQITTLQTRMNDELPSEYCRVLSTCAHPRVDIPHASDEHACTRSGDGASILQYTVACLYMLK